MILLDFNVQAVDLSTVQSPIDGTMTVVDALFRSHENIGGNCRVNFLGLSDQANPPCDMITHDIARFHHPSGRSLYRPITY